MDIVGFLPMISIFFFVFYIFWFFFVGRGLFEEPPILLFYFGAIKKHPLDATPRMESQPKRIIWWGVLPPLLCAFFQPAPRSCTNLLPSTYPYPFFPTLLRITYDGRAGDWLKLEEARGESEEDEVERQEPIFLK